MKKWKIGSPDKKVISRIMTGCAVSSLTAAALAAKGYTSPESVAESMNVSELSDPFLIRDMETAADILNEAVDSGEKICIYGDYDCDGIMATAILYSYLLEAGAEVMYYIPERSEGYGLNNNAIDYIHEQGAGLIVTVDNGISAISEAEHIYELGMRLLVTDHHQQGEKLPRAEAVVDPHRHDCPSPFKYACGAVIALKLVAAMDGGDYTMALEQFGDLAAIATVADIVSLTGENRFIVSYGLELINNTDRPALIALKEVCGLTDKKVDSYSIGFGLGPRINASGGFGSPRTALELFLTEDEDEAMRIARELDSLNLKRKEAEQIIFDEINEMIKNDLSLIRGRIIFICGKGWHHGVIGIVASRIMEKYGKPCFIASEENGEVRGSARSFGGLSAFSALSSAEDLLERFGGHPGAGGFTIKPGMTEAFHKRLEEYALKEHKTMPVMELCADSVLSSMELTTENIEGLELLEPFGHENEKPKFYIDNAEVMYITALSGGIHSKIGIRFGSAGADVLMFRTPPEELICNKGSFCDMIVTLGINKYKGIKSCSMIAEDIRIHGTEQNKYFAAMDSFEAFMRGEPLPEKYYPAMLPVRDDAVMIYKNIPVEGMTGENIYEKIKTPALNYCKFLIAAEALRQLGLISFDPSDSKFRRNKVSRKADLDSAPVLTELRRIIESSRS